MTGQRVFVPDQAWVFSDPGAVRPHPQSLTYVLTTVVKPNLRLERVGSGMSNRVNAASICLNRLNPRSGSGQFEPGRLRRWDFIPRNAAPLPNKRLHTSVVK
jgi:hypothetical protein